MSKAKPRSDEKVEQLQALLEAARNVRPTPADEEQMAALTGELLGGTKASLAAGVSALVRLPWGMAVRIAAEQWPNLKPLARRQFLAALTTETDEDARRIRLSLARGLLTVDAEVAGQILQSTCAAMLEISAAHGGQITNRDKQSFFNALIGKGKPWLHHVDASAWAPADQRALAECALQTAPMTAPFTQEALLRWAQSLQQLDTLSEATQALLIGGLRRWPGKLKQAWANPAEPLPEPLAAALRENIAPPSGAPESPEHAEMPSSPPAADLEAAATLSGRPSRPPEPPKPRQNAVIVQTIKVNQRQPEQRAPEFDLVASLRQIDNYVHGLRRELREAREQKQVRVTSRGRDQERASGPALSSGESETLAAHNARLENTVAHLREQLEELKQDHEDRAATMEEGDPLGQFKTLLALKLKDDFAEFDALRGQSANDVIRQHYGDLLRHVFEVLTAEGVALAPDARPA